MSIKTRMLYLRRRMVDHYANDSRKHLEFQNQKEELRYQYSALQRRIRSYQSLLRATQRYQRNGPTKEQIELQNKINAAQKEWKELHYKIEYGSFPNGDADFQRYYKHIRYTRPVVLIINLLLWFLLFWFGGLETGLKIVVLIFALITSIGSFSEMFFLQEIRERILKPIDSLKEGIYKVAAGDYDVTVNEEVTNEIGPLITAFNEMAEKLKKSEQLKAEYEENRKSLIANISHDLKTPITSVQGYIEVITSFQDIPKEKLLKYLKIIESNASYMNRLIDDLFLFSKLDMQKLDFHFDEVKIRPFIQDMMEEFRLDLEEKNIEFEYVDLLTEDSAVKLDGKRFYQIIRNIIDNAVKHASKPQLNITAKLYEADGFVHIDLTDNGSGIPEDKLEHIFERFYRVDTERTKDFSSTGLGLAIAMELAQAHGGNIQVVSELGKGSCFTVSIPLLNRAEDLKKEDKA